MRLLADVGNSRIKWELRDKSDICASGSAEHTEHDFFHILDRQWQTLTKPDSVWIATVGSDQTTEQIVAWCRGHWELTPQLPSSKRAMAGVRNVYEHPERLGIDRLMALVAARHYGASAACVADCGTALTVDALSEDGTHCGGIIVPGITVMYRAIDKHTHRVGHQAKGRMDVFAQSTQDALTAGTHLAAASVIDRFAAATIQRLGGVRCLLTGGDAPDVLPLLQQPFEYIPNLVLTGLDILADNTE